MEQNENLDLLDLEDSQEVDTLPEATPFSNPRPKRPWLLMGLGLAIIVLATWIIIARVGGDSGTSVNIDLDTPVETVKNDSVGDLNVPAKPVAVVPAKVEKEKPVEQKKSEDVKPVETNGTPVRVINDRKEVTFNPDQAVEQKTVVKPVKKAATKTATKPVAAKPVVTSTNGGVYVQFGSYSTRALAQSAEKKMRASHANLFSGKQFVILAANVKGQTIYRLRIAFNNSNDANGFCRNAKSDGLDCYVTK